MQLMAGLEQPTSGEVFFRGKNVTGVPVQKRNVAMVYQQFINYPNFTVYENIASPLRVAGMPDARDRRARQAHGRSSSASTPMLERRPTELSGGQQQRTAIARALVKDADLILLDEPLANLDYKLREELRDELPKLFAGRNCIVVYATTEPTEALLFGGHTATLARGPRHAVRPDRRDLPPPARPHHRPGLLRSADQYRADRQAGRRDPDRRQHPPARRQGRRGHPRRRLYAWASARITSPPIGATRHGAASRAACWSTELSRLGERHPFRPQRPHLGVAVARHPPLRGRERPRRLYVDVDQSFFFDADGRLIAGGA